MAFGPMEERRRSAGASYAELEWAMEQLKATSPDENWSQREREVMEIYNRLHQANKHKMQDIPVCLIPEMWKSETPKESAPLLVGNKLNLCAHLFCKILSQQQTNTRALFLQSSRVYFVPGKRKNAISRILWQTACFIRNSDGQQTWFVWL